MNIPCLFSFLTNTINFENKIKLGVLFGSTSRKELQFQICNSSSRTLSNSRVPNCCHIGASLCRLHDLFILLGPLCTITYWKGLVLIGVLRLVSFLISMQYMSDITLGLKNFFHSTYRRNCPAEIKISLATDGSELEVKSINEQHCHDVSQVTSFLSLRSIVCSIAQVISGLLLHPSLKSDYPVSQLGYFIDERKYG